MYNNLTISKYSISAAYSSLLSVNFLVFLNEKMDAIITPLVNFLHVLDEYGQ